MISFDCFTCPSPVLVLHSVVERKAVPIAVVSLCEVRASVSLTCDFLKVRALACVPLHVLQFKWARELNR